tara:strand:- start:311 stop:682 length:372 start_codon:yes stop_codon:yes gene_type:complete
MNNKIEIAFGKHIERLEKDIEATQKRIEDNDFDLGGLESQCVRDDAKKVALLREGVIPKYSDLPAGQVTGLNGLPEIEMSEFVNLLELVDESKAIGRDLDLIDYGKSLAGVGSPKVRDPKEQD